MIARASRRTVHARPITVLVILTCTGSLHAQMALEITAPVNGGVFSPGQTVSMSINSKGISSVFVACDGPGYTAPTEGPPFQISIPIPPTATPREYTFTAFGLAPSGKTGASARVTIKVERPDAPASLRVQPSILKLYVGQNGNLQVIATYSDGSTGYLTQAPSTTFVSSNTAVAAVTNYGIVTAVAPGSSTITVNGTVRVPVTVAPAMKTAPRQKALD